MKIAAIIMAAGHGTRMKSSLPKVLHSVAGRPLVYFPIAAAVAAGVEEVVVVVNPATHDQIAARLDPLFPDLNIVYAVQQTPQGTGDAVKAGMGALPSGLVQKVMILSGDAPLLRVATLLELLGDEESDRALTLMSFHAQNPFGYGRVVRSSSGQPLEIREERDLVSDEERKINEVNAGIYLATESILRDALEGISSNNAQNEYYLTDILPLIAARHPVGPALADEAEMAGVNDRQQLREVEEILFERIRRHHLKNGVSLIGSPQIDAGVRIDAGARIESGVVLRGDTAVASDAWIDVGTVVDSSEVGERAHIKPYSVLNQSVVGPDAQIGPMAHLRPGSLIDARAKVGNFVETKKAHLKEGAKVNHLSYVGDAEVGERANLGAGTIVCNYDGFLKHQTTIGPDAFIGSASQLIAPVSVGSGAYVATGTTVASDVPEDALAIARVRQSNKAGYATQLKTRLQAAAAEKKKS
ncbi:MAG: bifunctional UDP-N-acetylglucosamine diphosphorylase/glucosamine-1-phosphate N-acetyltransferase GlmU [Polyangiaceae bacterium]|nr:bifunctional UDP-N-acetylglucosamine diphosphorylase/glucosamine-1-phosphate N-acetyltransferase GlmU [Polyangiaceae bacterium]